MTMIEAAEVADEVIEFLVNFQQLAPELVNNFD